MVEKNLREIKDRIGLRTRGEEWRRKRERGGERRESGGNFKVVFSHAALLIGPHGKIGSFSRLFKFCRFSPDATSYRLHAI